MRFAVLDTEGIGLSWAARLKDEGHEVLYYIHEPVYREVGTGIVRKTDSLSDIYLWAKSAPTIALFMFSGMGKAKAKMPFGADDFRKAGIPVLLGGSFPDRMESDREFGMSLAKEIGIRQAPTFPFSTVEAAQAFLKAHKTKEWYFKPNHRPDGDTDTTQGGTGEQLLVYLDDYRERNGNHKSNIVQMKIPGVALSTNGWFNGHVFVPKYGGTIEHKRLMNDEIGPSTGCAINVVWFYPDEKSKIFEHLHFDRLGAILGARRAPAGLYDINAVIAEESGPWGPKGVPYFLEWTPRPGWDSEAISPRLLTGSLADFCAKLAHGCLEETPFRTDQIAYSTHLSVSPYPWGDPTVLGKLNKTARGKRLMGFESMWNKNFAAYGLARNGKGWYLANDEGNIGVAFAVGKNLKTLHKEVIEYAGTLQPKSMQFRTDGDKVLGKDAKRLSDLGYYMPPGLL